YHVVHHRHPHCSRQRRSRSILRRRHITCAKLCSMHIGTISRDGCRMHGNWRHSIWPQPREWRCSVQLHHVITATMFPPADTTRPVTSLAVTAITSTSSTRALAVATAALCKGCPPDDKSIKRREQPRYLGNERGNRLGSA
ncbi:hypothetical protein CCUS01_12446, partial [Colletotrichum cuscutae]